MRSQRCRLPRRGRGCRSKQPAAGAGSAGQYFLSALNSLGGVKTFALFLGLAIVSWLFIYRFAPETKGRQLEAIHEYWENGGVWPEHADRSSRTA
jgi:Sugar (and other) transporter